MVFFVKNLKSILLYFLVIFCITQVFIVKPWIGDDSLITFRSVDNFINGYGLRFNIGERVQSYTHPLWMFLLSLLYLFIRNPEIVSYLLSLICFISLFFILRSF